MRLLITGRGTSGSWLIRGEQLGAATGAIVTKTPTLQQCKDVDAIVVVKRVSKDVIETIRKSQTPFGLDILDCYPQPVSAAWTSGEAIKWVNNRIKALSPSFVIWPTKRMQADCVGGGFVLPHHHRLGIAKNPIRKRIMVVAYEGRVDYIQSWVTRINGECKRRGWSFTVNPRQLSDVDIVLAVRGPPWVGYPSFHWKSGVKIANAHGSGTPFIGQRESGYLEQASGAEYWVDKPEDLSMCFDWLEPYETRKQVSDRYSKCAYPVEAAAKDLVDGIKTLL